MKRLVADGEADQTSPCLGVSGSKPKAKRVRRCLPKDKSQNSTPGRRSSIYRGVTRRSSGFSRGVSKYRGVARHHHNGRWEARIGRVFGNKYLYLGTYSTQEEAAAAYDMAAIEYRGLNAVTNFDLSRYIGWLRPGQNTSSSDQESGSSPTAINDIQNMTNNNNSYECGSSTSALGLLLQSSKFKEMIERTSVNNIRSTSTTATAHHDLTASASAAAAAAAVQDLQSPSLDTTFSSDEIDMFFDTSDNILVNSDHHLSLSNINVAVESPNNMNMNMNMNIFLQGAHDEADMQQHLHEMPALELHEICSSTGEFFDFDRQGDDIEYPLIDPMSSINSISFPFPIRTCS